MLLMNPIKDAARAAGYFGKGDGGYWLDGYRLRCEWGGDLMERLGVSDTPTEEQLSRLLHGLHPVTGKQMTALLTEDRLAGWDVTARLPKGVTQALERGDTRILSLFHAAGDAAMEDVQAHAATRVRVDGKEEDRLTGNLGYLCREHVETRPTKEDGMPDWDRHMHYLVANATWDPVEHRIKALKVRDIFDLRKYFSHRFDARMADGLAALGYEIETKYEPDTKGGRRYYSWDIKAAPGCEADWQSAIEKNSRRHAETEAANERIAAAIKEKEKEGGNRDWEKLPDRLSATADYQLSRTTRQEKRKELTQEDLRAYWDGRLTEGEKAAIGVTIDRAANGLNPRPESKAAEARAYAMAHHFYRSSVVDFHDLVVTAIEQSMGAARPEDFAPEAWRKDGLLFQGNEVSTQAVLDQEQRVIGFAREGKGMFRPLAPGKTDGLEGLSAEQAAAVKHVWNSRDALMLIHGAPGAGKTTMMRPALNRLGIPAVLLAPSADASRESLRESGFNDADTVAAFFGSKDMQARARGGIIWIDEASLLGIDDLERVCGLAKDLKARVVLQGDPRQHKAVQRHGNMLEVLSDYAGLPVAEINQIQRQSGAYAQAVEAVRAGQYDKGVDILHKLGWIIEGEGHDKLAEHYAGEIEAEVKARKAGRAPRSLLIVDPTHRDGEALTEKLRGLRKAAGLISGGERTFTRLTGMDWTPAQRADAARYSGDEVIQFFRNAGKFKAGQRVAAAELLSHLGKVNAEHFGVFKPGEVKFAVGDTLRITNNGRDVTGKHRVDNGRIDTIAGFTRDGGIRLLNGWELDQSFAHWKHGLVSTSHSSQSKTKTDTWQQLNRASLGAAGAEQFLVSLSRGREHGLVFTDLPRDELVAAIKRADNRKSATEVFRPRPAAEARPAPIAAAAGEAAGKEQPLTERMRREYEHWRRRARRVERPLEPSVAARAAEWAVGKGREAAERARDAYDQWRQRRRLVAERQAKARASHAAKLRESRTRREMGHGR
jgi:conjugative relaxase-like TrwC/TraI family protein